MSVSFTNLKEFTRLSEKLPPELMRETINAYLETVIDPVRLYKGTVDNIMGDEVLALFGAPKYYRDHSIRALWSAAEQIHGLKKIQTRSKDRSVELHNCGVGISTGEMVLGGVGSWKNYTVMGTAVNMAALLAKLAQEGQILLTEFSMKDIFRKKPEAWIVEEIVAGKGNSVNPIPTTVTKHKICPIGSMTGIRFALGPRGNPAFLFEYLFAVKLRGMKHAIPIAAAIPLNLGDFKEEEIANPKFYSGVRIFGKYRLLEKLGRGGMGEVWRGRDDYGNEVAIKTLLLGNHASQEQIQRFAREAQIMIKLRHRGICRIHEVGEFEKIKYIAMEYINGVSLSEILEFGKQSQIQRRCSKNLSEEQTKIVRDFLADGHSSPSSMERKKDNENFTPYNIVPISKTVAIGRELCDAMRFAHENGVFHRDIKPQNILIQKDGASVIMDFGIARTRKEKNEPVLPGKSRVYGTIEYMAPEQARSSDDVNESADVYAIGAVIYQMGTGRKHFNSTNNLLKDIKQLQRHEPVRPRFYRPNMDRDLESIIIKSLKNKTQERYKTVWELGDDLARYQKNLPVNAQLKTPFYSLGKRISRNKIGMGWLISILLILAGFCIYIYFENKKREGKWIYAYGTDFRKSDADLGRYQFFTGDNGQPVTAWAADEQGMRAQPKQWCWLAGKNGSNVNGDVRIVMDIVNEGYPTFLMVGINLKKSLTRSWEHGMPGCVLQLGAMGGSVDVLNVLSVPGPVPKSNSKVVEKGLPRRFFLTLQRINDVYTCFINNRVHLQITDILPEYDEKRQHMGFLTASDSMRIREIAVYRMTRPREASPLIVGDALLSQNRIQEALDEFLTISEDYFQTSIGEEALVKAYPIVLKGGMGFEHMILPIQSDYYNHYPQGVFKTKFRNIEALAAWKKKDYSKAINYLDTAFQENSTTKILSHIELKTTPQPYAKALINQVRQQSQIIVVESSFRKDIPINHFRETKVSQVYMAGNQLNSLNGLKTSYLQLVHCPMNQLGGLSGLSDAPLIYMNVGYNNISEIPDWSNAHLAHINMAGNRLSTFPSVGLENIRYLNVSENHLNLLNLKHAVSLRVLHASDNRLKNIYLPQNVKLNQLNLRGNQLRRLDHFGKLYVQELDIRDNQLDSLSFISQRSMRRLLAGGNPFRSLEPIRSMSFGTLGLRQTRVRDYSVLNAISIQNLDVSDNQWTEIPSLHNKHIRSLNLDNNKIRRLDNLQHLNVEHLSIAGNRVKNLQPLAKLKLTYLNCQNNPISSLAPFVTNPPDTFYFDGRSLTNKTIRSALIKWSGNKRYLYNAYYAEVVLCIRQKNITALKRLSSRFERGRYLHITKPVRWTEAKKICERLGGHLVTINSSSENQMIGNILKNKNPSWIGLRQGENGLVWENGEVLSYYNMLEQNVSKKVPYWKFGGWNHGQQWIGGEQFETAGFIIEWD